MEISAIFQKNILKFPKLYFYFAFENIFLKNSKFLTDFLKNLEILNLIFRFEHQVRQNRCLLQQQKSLDMQYCTNRGVSVTQTKLHVK